MASPIVSHPPTKSQLPHTATSDRQTPALLSPFSLTDRDSPTSSSASYTFDFAPPRIESLNVIRQTHRTRPKPAHAFDQLPWISAMDSAPEYTDPWDIADLSQIPLSDPTPAPPRPKVGPIRTARSALRLRTGKQESENESSRARRVPFTLRDASRAPRTPRHTITSIRFHSLMPEFSFASLNNSRQSDPCSSSLKKTTPQSSCSSLLASQNLPPTACQRSCHDLFL